MPSLHEVQRAVARSVFSADAGEALAHVAGGTIAAAERFAVHRNNAAVTLTEALRLVYPVVDKLVGAEFFTGAARAFIARHPPRTACLNDYGAEFADFLAAFPPAANLTYLPDVTRLEWAVHGALNAADTAALEPSALTTLEESAREQVRFVPHPAVRLLTLHHPADAIWRAVRDGDEAALATFELAVAPISLLVERRGDGIAVRRLAPEDARVSALLFAGAPLSEVAAEQDGATLVALLAEHLAFGRFAGFAAEAKANSE